jgi:hypothetical protein
MSNRPQRKLKSRILVKFFALVIAFAGLTVLSAPGLKADDGPRGITIYYWSDDTYTYIVGGIEKPCTNGYAVWGETSAWSTIEYQTCNE